MHKALTNTLDELDISFPDKKFDSYLRNVNIKADNHLAYEVIQEICLLIISDFKCGKVSLDELCSMLGYLWGKLDKKLMHSSELGDVLDAASELSFYVRAVDDQDCADTFIFFLQKVLDYYERNKNQAK